MEKANNPEENSSSRNHQKNPTTGPVFSSPLFTVIVSLRVVQRVGSSRDGAVREVDLMRKRYRMERESERKG